MHLEFHCRSRAGLPCATSVHRAAGVAADRCLPVFRS
jgi:hypothetical protein